MRFFPNNNGNSIFRSTCNVAKLPTLGFFWYYIQTFSVISHNRVTKAYDKQKPDMSLSTHARICGCVDRTLWPPISTRHGLKKPLVQRSEQSICAMMNLPMHDKAFYAMHCWVQMVFEIYNVCIHNIYIYYIYSVYI